MKPFKTIKESTKWFYNSSAYSIMMPALAVSTAETYFAKPFVKLVNTPGVIYVTIDKSEERSMEKMLESIGSTWPIFVIVSLLTLEGGIIIWLLVRQSTLFLILYLLSLSLSLSLSPRDVTIYID